MSKHLSNVSNLFHNHFTPFCEFCSLLRVTKKAQSGNALILVAILLPVVLGFVSFATDLTRVMTQRVQMQTLADSVVLNALNLRASLGYTAFQGNAAAANFTNWAVANSCGVLGHPTGDANCDVMDVVNARNKEHLQLFGVANSAAIDNAPDGRVVEGDTTMYFAGNAGTSEVIRVAVIGGVEVMLGTALGIITNNVPGAPQIPAKLPISTIGQATLPRAVVTIIADISGSMNAEVSSCGGGMEKKMDTLSKAILGTDDGINVGDGTRNGFLSMFNSARDVINIIPFASTVDPSGIAGNAMVLNQGGGFSPAAIAAALPEKANEGQTNTSGALAEAWRQLQTFLTAPPADLASSVNVAFVYFSDGAPTAGTYSFVNNGLRALGSNYFTILNMSSGVLSDGASGTIGGKLVLDNPPDGLMTQVPSRLGNSGTVTVDMRDALRKAAGTFAGAGVCVPSDNEVAPYGICAQEFLDKMNYCLFVNGSGIGCTGIGPAAGTGNCLNFAGARSNGANQMCQFPDLSFCVPSCNTPPVLGEQHSYFTTDGNLNPRWYSGQVGGGRIDSVNTNLALPMKYDGVPLVRLEKEEGKAGGAFVLNEDLNEESLCELEFDDDKQKPKVQCYKEKISDKIKKAKQAGGNPNNCPGCFYNMGGNDDIFKKIHYYVAFAWAKFFRTLVGNPVNGVTISSFKIFTVGFGATDILASADPLANTSDPEEAYLLGIAGDMDTRKDVFMNMLAGTESLDRLGLARVPVIKASCATAACAAEDLRDQLSVTDSRARGNYFPVSDAAAMNSVFANIAGQIQRGLSR